MTTREGDVRLGRLARATLAALVCAGCAPARAATFRWGGRAAVGGYLVDMGTVRRAGSRVDFETVFAPLPTPQKPELAKAYVRARQTLDCASGLQREKGSQAYADSGQPIGGANGPDPAATPIRSGSTWSSVRDLVCRGSNDLPAGPLTGPDPQVVAQIRTYMAAHPVRD